MSYREKGSLRILREEDLELILQWRNSDRVRNSMLSNHIISGEEHQTWFQRLKKNDIYLIFEFKHEPAGLVNFTDMNTSEGTCWWGFYLGKGDLPKGTGFLMGYLGLEHIFDKQKISAVYSKVLAANLVSMGYHKKLGFTEEKTEKQYVIRDGEKQEIVMLSYKNESWKRNKPELQAAIIIV